MEEIKELLEVMRQELRTGLSCPAENPHDVDAMRTWLVWARRQPSLPQKRKPIGHVRHAPDWDNVAGYYN